MKKTVKRFTSMLLVITMAMTISATPALAASRTYTTGGNGQTGVTFTVKTGTSSSSRKLTFEQKKGIYSYQNIFMGTSTHKTYSRFCIYVQEVGGAAKAYYCDYKSGTSVTLKSNSTFKVSIIPTEAQFVWRDLLNSGKLSKASFLNWFYGQGHWSVYPTWVVSTKAAMSNVKSTILNSSIY